MPNSYQLYIGGEWLPAATGETYERRSPATGELVGVFAKGNAPDTEQAIRVAREAFDRGPWPRMSGSERAAVLHKVANLLRERADETARQEAAQVGLPYHTVTWLNWYVADVFDYYAGMARHVHGRSVLSSAESLSLTLREPLGVVGIISPWNFPLVLSAWKVAAALAAGCTMVVKPASYTPITCLELGAMLAEVGLPQGVYNVVTGPGAVVGEALVKSHLVNAIAFTGETSTGKQLLTQAAPTLKRVSLELGGKSPMIVHHDANLDKAVGGALEVFYNAGQQCNVPSRLLLHEAIYDDFMGRFKAKTRAMRVGATFDAQADMGPLVSAAQLETVLGYIESGKKEGARLESGGERLQGGTYDQGYYLSPTIFSEVRRGMRIVDEEIFGPVVVVMPYRELDEAIELANDSSFGLTAGIWTNNLDAAHACARRLNAGTVWINVWNKSFPEIPVGGNKDSGVGRELGIEGLEEFTTVKGVHIFPGG
ncbi:MAG: aldehyde dehydrogenase family protein [Anaerolineae bacterium]|nr:aldehyde dehydrogenase family protein [Anaerolineae bacterium]